MSKLKNFKYRFWLWSTRPLVCSLGFHKFDWDEWGSSPCSGSIDFYCRRCQKKIRTIPFDDLPPKEQERKSEIFKDGDFYEGGNFSRS
jgi:hypothetical protein